MKSRRITVSNITEKMQILSKIKLLKLHLIFKLHPKITNGFMEEI